MALNRGHLSFPLFAWYAATAAGFAGQEFAALYEADREYVAKEQAANVALNGTIKRLVIDRGFGFLSGDDGKESFFHRSSVDGSFEALQEGQKVTFDIESNAPKGPRAARVRVA